MTNQIPSSEGPAVVAGGILKTDVLGRITIGREQREAILNAFESNRHKQKSTLLELGVLLISGGKFF